MRARRLLSLALAGATVPLLGAVGTGTAATATGAPLVLTSGQTVSGRTISNPSGPCIVVAAGATGVVVKNNKIGPCGTTVDGLGIRIDRGAGKVTISGNSIHDVASGVYANHAVNPIVVDANTFWNIRGPMPRGQAVQFDNVTGSGGQSKVVNNVSDKNAATITTHYEDHINMYMSSGTAKAPIVIACNRLRGGDSATGSGIMVGDYGGGYYRVVDNTLVLTSNTGIGDAGGHDVVIARNWIYNRGATAASQTSLAGSAFTYAGNTPTNLTMSDNRGVANGWLYGGTGELSSGWWDDGSIRNFTHWGNHWQDTTLTASIWSAARASCPAS